MTISQQTSVSFNRLRTVLGELLRRQNPEFSISENSEYPLLVLETSSNAVGFAVVNGTPDISFASAYASFKQLYHQNHNTWKNQNLSFVLCRSDPKASDDAFFRSIEADMYFCRKYVVRLGSDRDSLERELLRLPFTPLPEAVERGVEIPPSAQTLLQRIGVTASLAQKIVNPGVCSAERLADELITGVERLPSLEMAEKIGHYERAETKNIARIKNISIEAFRAYRSRQEFDLDADVIVLYGQNGLGKTSFFDAIDYACTGRIGRLCQGRVKQNEFRNMARHLDASIHEGLVSMQITKSGDDSLVLRKIEDWSHAHIDKQRFDRASLMQFLTSAEWGSKKPRVNKLEAIFRATHLFSQTEPELLSTFEQNSTLSSEIVSRMLALDDYSAGLRKVSEARGELEKKQKQNQKYILILNTEENELVRRIKSLPDSLDPIQAGDQLKKMALEIAELLKSEINVTIDTAEISPTSAREWRSLVEAELKNSNENLHNLRSIEQDFNSFTRTSHELELISEELEKAEGRLKDHSSILDHNQQSLKKLTSRLKRNQNILSTANSKLLALSELVDHQEAAEIAKSSLSKLRKELARVTEGRGTTNSELQEHNSALEILQIRFADVKDEYQVISDRVQALNHIQEGIPTWIKELRRITELEESIESLNLAIKTSDSKISDLKVIINHRENELKNCEKNLAESTESELTLTLLLDEIESHIHNEYCPACGTQHESKKDLLEKINFQKQERSPRVEALTKRCRELQNLLADELDTLDSQASEHSRRKQELEEIENKLRNVRKSVGHFETTVRNAEFAADQQLTTEVARKITDDTATQSTLMESLNILEAEIATTKKQISRLERKHSIQINTRKRINSEIEVLREQISTIHKTIDEQDLTLELSSDEIAELVNEAQGRKERASDRINDLALQAEASERSIGDLELENYEFIQKIEGLHRNVAKLNDEVGRYQKRAVGELGRVEITFDTIQKKNRNAEERVDLLDDLRKRALTLERSLDSSQRSAMLAELEADTLAIAKEKEKIHESNDRVEVIKKWFSRVERALSRQNSNAVANYVEAFGPLTSLIQRRLRAVFGFGDINLKARGDEIHVRVKRKGEQYKPAIYFSESQKQILMLSIFLAGRITQTWSGFAPILMDDPVTHFDDLNAFGFVEFMRGVINTSPGERQFIISTCEERLFDLMLKKFKGATGGAMFYKFIEIGPDGPRILKITN